jgi:iron-sulfur cluster assembly accessory protein
MDISALTITPNAAKRVATILQNEPAGAMFRVAVNGGGCSGFQYEFSVVTSQANDDLSLTQDGIAVLVDPISLDYLKGSCIDYVDDLMGQSFKISNPNATASCGCGTSFSI